MTGLLDKILHYTIYETTNLVNGKTYIGKHITTNPNDSYLGSGKLLKASIDKYGEEWFEKTVLFVFDSEEEMNQKEKELVTEEFCSFSSNYNLCPGGKGGWGFVNSDPEALRKRDRKENKIKGYKTSLVNFWVGKNRSENTKMKISQSLKGKPNGNWLGKRHSEETLQKMRKPKNQGEKNSQFGSMWITNGSENRKIKKIDIIPEGWYKGRK